ncbi:hypothetical protein JB92DRAFT_3136547 [Gautieria morchelliformis]|nr:hypothetical protein JB92DRAFT_3136547 [Gautieria morchelliformis]
MAPHKKQAKCLPDKARTATVSSKFTEKARDVPLKTLNDDATKELMLLKEEILLLQDDNKKLKQSQNSAACTHSSNSSEAIKIPKPKGEVGRSGKNANKPGYNLQDEMGLTDHNPNACEYINECGVHVLRTAELFFHHHHHFIAQKQITALNFSSGWQYGSMQQLRDHLKSMIITLSQLAAKH